MLAVEVWLRRVRDKELTAIGIRSCVGHRNYTGIVSQRVAFDFIFELVAGTAFAVSRRVAALDGGAGDSVKRGPVEESGAGQADEVVGRRRQPPLLDVGRRAPGGHRRRVSGLPAAVR